MDNYYKQNQVMLYALEKRSKFNRTQLMTVIFLTDLFAVNKRKAPFLEDFYIKTMFGFAPQYGYLETEIRDCEGKLIKPDVIVYKNRDKKYPNDSYYYQFNARKVADLSIFSESEIQLINQSILVVKYLKMNDISRLIYGYSFYKTAKINHTIPLTDMILSDDEMNDLELFLRLKSYLTPELPPPFWNFKQFIKTLRHQEIPKYALINDFPEKFPVFFDEYTKEIIKL